MTTTKRASVDVLFHPRSVAVVGVSGQAKGGFSGVGLGFLVALKEFGFEPLYPVNPKYDEIEGLRCYASVKDIEGPVDHVNSSVPAPAVAGLVEDCIAKRVRSLHFFTAGFSETGDEEMVQMEGVVVARARAGGLRVLGPNCMGLYVPGSRISFQAEFPKEPGNFGFISQSGGNAVEMVMTSRGRGIRFSKLISYGNAVDIAECELLEALAADPLTEIIGLYVEGVRDGRRFVRALKSAAAAKPVIVLKGGRTVSGTRAVMSHTASLAGSAEIFDAVCRQAGAVRVNSVEELADLAVAFRFMGMPAGPGAALITPGGGTSVFAADQIDEAGLSCPLLPEETQAALREFNPAAGTSLRNPVDTMALFEPGGAEKSLRIVGSAPNVDVVLVNANMGWGSARRAMGPGAGIDPDQYREAFVQQLVKARAAISKPVAVVSGQPMDVPGMERTVPFRDSCWTAGLPVFTSIPNAARAIAKVLHWQTMHK
jgi:acyl-CoA synthetase (NDP forming)